MSTKNTFCLFLLFFCFTVVTSSFASEAYLEDVIIDVDSFKDNPWNIFGVYIDADTPSDEISNNVSRKISFYNLKNVSEFDYRDSPWEVSGTDYHPEFITYGFDPESIECNYNGIFASSKINLDNGSFVDSYDSSNGSYGSNNNIAQGHIYCNGTINLNGNAYVRGDVTAHEIILNGNSFIEGSQTTSDQTWDNLRSMVETLKPVVMSLNNNSNIGMTSLGNPPFFPEDSSDFYLEDTAEITLEEGIYYFETISLHGSSRLNINGRVIIFCNELIDISGNVEVNFEGNPNNLALYSFGNDINVRGKSQVYAQLYAVTGNVAVTGTSDVFGRIVADQIEISGNGKVHFNSFEPDKMLQFAVTQLYNENNEIIDESIDVFSIKSTIIAAWKIEIEKGSSDKHGHFVKYLWLNNSWQRRGNIVLRGYGDYDLLWNADQFRTIKNAAGGNNMWTELLQYTYGLNSGRLNFHRAWAFDYSIIDKPNNAYDQYDQPFKYLNKTITHQDHPELKYHLYNVKLKQNCNDIPSGAPAWTCYWDRLSEALSQATLWGVVVEIDFFDWSMMNAGTCWEWNGQMWAPYDCWPCNPYYRNNQKDENGNDIYSPALELPTSSEPGYNFYYSYAPDTGIPTDEYDPQLKYQQEALVDMIVKASTGSAVVFYEPMNEANFSDDWYPTHPYPYKKPCVYWHDGIEQKAKDTWDGVRKLIPHPSYLMGISILAHSTDHTITYTQHQNATKYLFTSTSPSDYSLSNKNRFTVISYHAPFWETANCGNRIYNFKAFCDNSINNITTKAILIDTDGANTYCRDTATDPGLYRWAYDTFEHSTNEDYADFNSKHTLHPVIAERMYQIDKAYDDAY